MKYKILNMVNYDGCEDSLDDLKVLNKLSYSDNLKLYSIQRKLQEEVTSNNTQNLLNSTEIKYVSNLLNRKSAYVQFLTYEEMDSSETKMITKWSFIFVRICSCIKELVIEA